MDQVYQASTETFLPTPVKSHYLFNMRDVAKVIEGVMQVRHSTLCVRIFSTYRLPFPEVRDCRWLCCIVAVLLEKKHVHGLVLLMHETDLGNTEHRGHQGNCHPTVGARVSAGVFGSFRARCCRRRGPFPRGTKVSTAWMTYL